MRVILKDHVNNLGKPGEIVKVRDGYGRNFLLPRGLAVTATERDVARVEHEQRVIAAAAAKKQKELEGDAARISQAAVEIAVAVGDEDRMFGSVTSRDIAAALAAKGVTIDAKKIVLDEPIKTLGTTEVKVKVGHGIDAKVSVTVVKQG